MCAFWRPLPPELSANDRAVVEALRAVKDTRGLTFADLAAKTHYSRSSWQRWLNGSRLITEPALDALSTAFGIEVRTSGDGRVRRDDHEADPGGVAQMPGGTADFCGRVEEVQLIRSALIRSPGVAGSPTVFVISGGGGMGKTSLALHAAHGVVPAFPDGHLYANLHGLDTMPAEPGWILSRWLRALGDASHSSGTVEEQAARLRGRLSDRRVLILLDDARDSRQVRPLLPASGGCAVLVTTRHRLTLPEARRLELDALRPGEALALLERHLGRARPAAEPQAAAELVELCGGLPLAVRIVAARLASRPAWQLSTLADRLRDPRRRLDELEVDDLAVRARFQLSYELLAHSDTARDATGFYDARRAFRCLGRIDAPDISLSDAAAVLGCPIDQAESVLEHLVDCHLLDSATPGCYRFHDLVRLYAAELAAEDDAVRAPPSSIRALVS